jgi:hypothetical protein
MENTARIVDIEQIDISIQMLEKYVQDDSIKPIISILNELKKNSDDESLLKKLAETLKSLGIIQGAVLTYAPYVGILVSNNLFDD